MDTKSKQYHHGDLRTAMIEKGFYIINTDGVKSLTLRRVAKECGVSHSAPYSHFANKDELFQAITAHITAQFANVLKSAVSNDEKETPEGLIKIGCAYVMFFAHNPEYFKFIFTNSKISVGVGHPYEPYDFFMGYTKKVFDNINYPQELRFKTVIEKWARIHGLAAIVIMNGRKEIPLWQKLVPEILSANNNLVTNGEIPNG